MLTSIPSQSRNGTTITHSVPSAIGTTMDTALGASEQYLMGSSEEHIDHLDTSDPVIKVVLVDDNALVRNGIRSILADHADMQIVGEASDGIEAIILVEYLHPSIVLMDINMPRMNGIDATARIKTAYPDTIIIGLSVNASTENQETMTRAGAARLIPKEKAADLLYDVMHETIKSR